MGRPKKAKTLATVSVRLPTALIEEIDRYTEKLQAEGALPGFEISRADAIRHLLMKALRSGPVSKK